MHFLKVYIFCYLYNQDTIVKISIENVISQQLNQNYD